MEENLFNSDINSINNQEVIKQNKEQNEKNDNEQSDQPKKCRLSTILAIVAVIILIICIILVVIIIVFVRTELTRPPTPEEIIGSIKCIYFIEKDNSEIEILSNDYQNKYDLDIVIDNKRIELSKKYKFINSGIHNIDIYIDKNETMDYMFKNII